VGPTKNCDFQQTIDESVLKKNMLEDVLLASLSFGCMQGIKEMRL